MSRIAFPLTFALTVALTVAACGDDDAGSSADAAPADPSNPGFVTPTITTTAYEMGEGGWVEVGPADWSCLGTADDLGPTTVETTIAGQVNDFLSGDGVPAAEVAVFSGIDVGGEPIAEVTTAEDGAFELALPAGTDRVAYQVSANLYLDTYLVNQRYPADAGAADQVVRAVSQSIADVLPATIDRERDPALGNIAGAIRDCQGKVVKGAIATVSLTAGTPVHLEGAATYYFSAGSQSLPVLPSASPATNDDGLFVIFDLPPTASAFLQVWGFTAAQDPSSDELTLLGEIPVPVVADTIITASVDPLRQ